MAEVWWWTVLAYSSTVQSLLSFLHQYTCFPWWGKSKHLKLLVVQNTVQFVIQSSVILKVLKVKTTADFKNKLNRPLYSFVTVAGFVSNNCVISKQWCWPPCLICWILFRYINCKLIIYLTKCNKNEIQWTMNGFGTFVELLSCMKRVFWSWNKSCDERKAFPGHRMPCNAVNKAAPWKEEILVKNQRRH